MRSFLVAALLLSLTLPVVPAWAQSPRSTGTELQTEIRRKRVVVLPRLDPQLVAQDVERAQTNQGIRQKELVREVTQEAVNPYAGRPNLDPDVVSAIQQRNIRRLSGR